MPEAPALPASGNALTVARVGTTLRITITASCTTGATAPAAIQAVMPASRARWKARAASAQAASNTMRNDPMSVTLGRPPCRASICSGMNRNSRSRTSGARERPYASSTRQAMACWLRKMPKDESA